MYDTNEFHYHSYPIEQGMLTQICKWLSHGSHLSIIGLTGSRRRRLFDQLIGLSGQSLGLEPGKVTKLTILPVDMVNLQEVNERQLYRLMLRTLIEQRGRFDASAENQIARLNQLTLLASDSFTLQSTLRNILALICKTDAHIVFVCERFDEICTYQTTAMAARLVSLLAGFEDRTALILGLRGSSSSQGVKNVLIGVPGARSLWVGGLTDAESRAIFQETLSPDAPDSIAIDNLVRLTGGYPALINATIAWWRESLDQPDPLVWEESLYENLNTQSSLHQLWDDLTFAERHTLYDLQNIKPGQYKLFFDENRHILKTLLPRGTVKQLDGCYILFSPLFRRFVRDMRHTLRGRVWFNDMDDTFYQGELPLTNLSPRAEAALEFFLDNPYKKCDKDQLIYHIWESPHVTDDSVYQVIRELRRHLELDTRKPAYILNHRSLRGGRYQFFPEGRDNYSFRPNP